VVGFERSISIGFPDDELPLLVRVAVAVPENDLGAVGAVCVRRAVKAALRTRLVVVPDRAGSFCGARVTDWTGQCCQNRDRENFGGDYRSDLEAKPDLDRSTDAVYKGFFARIGDAIAEAEGELKQFLDPNTAEAERIELWMAMHPDRDRPNFMALDPWIYEWAAHQSSAPSPALKNWHDVDRHNGSVLLGLRHGVPGPL
jgi:hypothetical protein